jgi:hypothetical protein
MVRLMYLTLAVSAVIGISASAQTDGKGSSKLQLIAGVVKTVSGSSLTLDRGGDKPMVIGVDSSTRLIAGTTTRVGDLVYRRGPRLAQFVKAGDQVTVTYRQSGSAMSAVEVRVARK